MATKILDTDDNTTTHLPRLKAAGVTTVIRYLARSHSWKTVTPNEAKAIANAGLKLGLVFETTGKPHGSSEGNLDGEAAVKYAKEVGAPPGAVIWYAVDYDPNPLNMPGIEQAFVSFGKKVKDAGYRVGAYASGYCNGILYEKKIITMRWLTQSLGFRGTRAAIKNKEYELLQLLPKTVAGLDVDPDMQLIPNGDIGDFVPFSPTPAQPEDA